MMNLHRTCELKYDKNYTIHTKTGSDSMILSYIQTIGNNLKTSRK